MSRRNNGCNIYVAPNGQETNATKDENAIVIMECIRNRKVGSLHTIKVYKPFKADFTTEQAKTVLTIVDRIIKATFMVDEANGATAADVVRIVQDKKDNEDIYVGVVVSDARSYKADVFKAIHAGVAAFIKTHSAKAAPSGQSSGGTSNSGSNSGQASGGSSQPSGGSSNSGSHTGGGASAGGSQSSGNGQSPSGQASNGTNSGSSGSQSSGNGSNGSQQAANGSGANAQAGGTTPETEAAIKKIHSIIDSYWQ